MKMPNNRAVLRRVFIVTSREILQLDSEPRVRNPFARPVPRENGLFFEANGDFGYVGYVATMPEPMSDQCRTNVGRRHRHFKSTQAELSHPALEPPLRDLQEFDHGVEVTCAPLVTRFDLLAGEIHGLPDSRALLDSVVQGGPGDAKLRGGPLDAPAVGSQGFEELVLGGVLGASIIFPGFLCGRGGQLDARGASRRAVRPGHGARGVLKKALGLEPHAGLAVAAGEDDLADEVPELADVA